MKVWILGRGDMSGEWTVLGVYGSKDKAEEVARALPGFRIKTTGEWRDGPHHWLDISEHEVQS